MQAALFDHTGPLSPFDREERDVADALRRAPADATIKGMFINGLIDMAASQPLAHPDGLAIDDRTLRRRPTFKDEPLRDFMRLAVAVARNGWPGRPLRDGLKAVGAQTYRTFLESLTGRVVFGVLGKNIVGLIGATTKAYGLTQSHGRAVVVDASDDHCVLEYRELHQFLDSLEVGVVEEAVRSCGLVPLITLELDSPTNGRMHIRFERR